MRRPRNALVVPLEVALTDPTIDTPDETAGVAADGVLGTLGAALALVLLSKLGPTGDTGLE
ncbi:MAG TPA: hypothetical protein VGZ27_03600 [Vicinamibacterales bacterium]|nr:hypothetical protein [Vicinamibacterales bacterium]